MLRRSITMQKESAWHASMPDRFFIALSSARSRAFSFVIIRRRSNILSAADLKMKSAKMFTQLYKRHSKAYPQAVPLELISVWCVRDLLGKT